MKGMTPTSFGLCNQTLGSCDITHVPLCYWSFLDENKYKNW